MLIKAEIHEWTDGEELEQILLHLVNTIGSTNNNNSAQLLSADCKLQTISAAVHETLPQVLSVTQ